MHTKTADPKAASRESGRLARAMLEQRFLWFLPFIAAILPIVLLSVYALRTASGSVEQLVKSHNVSLTTTVSQILSQDFTKTAGLVQETAALPSLLAQIGNRNPAGLNRGLEAVVAAHPDIDRAFVTDAKGALLSDYPTVPGEIRKQFAETDWYRGVTVKSRPYISSAYRSPLPGRPLVVAIASPMSERDGRIVGMLVFEYRLDRIAQISQGGDAAGTLVYVIDHTGTLVSHPQVAVSDRLGGEYRRVPQIRDALTGTFFAGEYDNPDTNQRMIATFLPITVGFHRWVVVAEQPVTAAYAPLRRVQFSIGIAGAMLSVLTLVQVVLLAYTRRKNDRLAVDLRSKNQQLRDITSIVSHQLKTPVTAISWTLELLLEGNYGRLEPDVRKALESLRDVNKTSSGLITDILNASRIDRGVITVDLAPVRLSDVLDLATRDYRPIFLQKKLELRLEKGKEDIIVLADKEKLVEAIGNSVSNALKHTRQGSITLRMRREGNTAFVDVTDTGEGMTPEILGKLFTRDQITGAEASPESSSGLGLYIAKSFMELQHGTVTAKSEAGKGSTFTYGIPVAEEKLSA